MSRQSDFQHVSHQLGEHFGSRGGSRDHQVISDAKALHQSVDDVLKRSFQFNKSSGSIARESHESNIPTSKTHTHLRYNSKPNQF